MKRDGLQYIQLLRRRLFFLRATEGMLFFGGVFFLSGSLLQIFGLSYLYIIPLVIVAGVVLISRVSAVTNNAAVVAFLNKHHPALTWSADLLLVAEDRLSLMQRLQRLKTQERLAQIYPEVRLPHRLPKAAAVFVLFLLVAVVLPSFDLHIPDQDKDAASAIQVAGAKELPAEVSSLEVKVTAPRYTGWGEKVMRSPEFAAPEGSVVNWKVSFSGPAKNTLLVFAEGDTVHVAGDKFSASRKFFRSSYYFVSWQGADGQQKSSPFYAIDISPDLAPEITIPEFPQFTEVSVNDRLSFSLKAYITDDYSVAQAYIVATVSKGSGESVKFREEKLLFDSPVAPGGKAVSAVKSIDVVKLGLEPGDELYFYVVAGDNRQPGPQFSRTETFFISLLDTADVSLSVEGVLGVDLMPEYFRSQRQIIIDSEKLLREKKVILESEFKGRSNELGFDQKVLRLKYGEFLGEEFESAMVQTEASPADQAHDREEKDVTEKFGHVHDDEENDHAHEQPAVAQEDEHHGHDHSGDHGDEKQDPLKEFYHIHDDPEEATFFIESIRTRLKAALSLMWDAELQLRLYSPEKSLPYQYRILRILKEISNDSRIYVHKTGLDAPPVKEDKRLTGDLSETKSSVDRKAGLVPPKYPSSLKAIQILNNAIAGEVVPELVEALRRAAGEVSAAALEDPARYLHTLTTIKSVLDDTKNVRPELLRLIRKDLINLAGPSVPVPGSPRQNLHPVDLMFLEKLNP